MGTLLYLLNAYRSDVVQFGVSGRRLFDGVKG